MAPRPSCNGRPPKGYDAPLGGRSIEEMIGEYA
jgi:hypothetical protein